MNCDSVSSAQSSSLEAQLQIMLQKKQQDATKTAGESAVSLIQAAAGVGKKEGSGDLLDALA